MVFKINESHKTKTKVKYNSGQSQQTQTAQLKNQSELEAKLIHVTSTKSKKTHATKSVGFGFVSHWLRVPGASFVKQLQREVKQNQCKHAIITIDSWLADLLGSCSSILTFSNNLLFGFILVYLRTA